jgi:pyrroline-5-carboxylate reductase
MKIAFIGGGNMANALIGGLRRGGAAHAIAVLEIDPARARQLRDAHRVEVHTTAGEWLAACAVVVLAVKPQQAAQAVAAIQPHLARPLLLSIAAGVRAQTLARWLQSDVIVRTMPNTPALIGAGITGAVALAGVTAEQRASAGTILGAVGEVVWFDDETLLDAVTAVSGSGPAYAFYLIEAMQQAGRELGLSDADARRLAVATVSGAAQLAAASADPVEVLRERVTSKGGTTAAALAELEAASVKRAFVTAIRAADARARALGDELDGDA